MNQERFAAQCSKLSCIARSEKEIKILPRPIAPFGRRPYNMAMSLGYPPMGFTLDLSQASCCRCSESLDKTMPHNHLSLTRQQARDIDRLALEQYGIPTLLLMENAARAVSQAAFNMLVQSLHRRVLILCGPGNNGGDGLAAARHLHNLGCEVQIFLLADATGYKGDAATNLAICQKMNLPIQPATAENISQAGTGLIIDALFGTGLTAAPRDPFGDIARTVNRSGNHVLAVDLPSGLDADTGHPLGGHGPDGCIRAAQTITFVAYKRGFSNIQSARWTGQILEVADIGCPVELIQQVRENVKE